MSYKESFEYRMGWHDCYMVVLKSLEESQESELSRADTILNVMDDVREVQE